MKGSKIKKAIFNFPLFCIATCICITIFFYFRWNSKQDQQKSITVIEGLLRNESLVANSYALAKSVLDLEQLNFITCAVVYENNDDQRPFYNTTTKSACAKNNFLRRFNETEIKLKAINGLTYLIKFQRAIQWQSVILELLAYLFIIALFMIYERHHKAQNLRLVFMDALVEQSKQVSHDIRSPLTVLNLITSTLVDIPEEMRITLRSATNRINDIANELLKNVQTKQEHFVSEKQIQVKPNTEVETKTSKLENIELLPALIDALVSEKRIQFRELNNLTIETELEESYGAFAKINSTEFNRLISNIINNAVEATKKPNGRIVISVKNYDTKIIVSVRDNGNGIPLHILARLGEQGVTYGKEGTASGSGLGVYHAKKMIESFGAKFIINSHEGRGTEVRMEFQKCDVPEWFVPELKISPNQTIVALDDDSSILGIWQQRIKNLNCPSINLITYTSENDLIDWAKTNSKVLKDTLFLIDYELLGQHNSGLDLIELLSLNVKAILVTSRYEEPVIRKRCEQLKVKQIPKGMAPFVPIEVI